MTTQINHGHYFYYKTLSPSNKHCTLYLRYIVVECNRILNAVWHWENFVHSLNSQKHLHRPYGRDMGVVCEFVGMSNCEISQMHYKWCRKHAVSDAVDINGLFNGQPIRLAYLGLVVYTTETGYSFRNIEVTTKGLSFCRRHRQMHFLESRWYFPVWCLWMRFKCESMSEMNYPTTLHVLRRLILNICRPRSAMRGRNIIFMDTFHISYDQYCKHIPDSYVMNVSLASGNPFVAFEHSECYTW